MPEKINALYGLRRHIFSFLIWLLTIFAFARSLGWLAEKTIVHDQIAHAAFVLFFGVLFMMRDVTRVGSLAFKFSDRTWIFLLGADVMAMLAGILRQPLLMPMALGLLAAAILLFVYGDPIFRLAVGFGCAFFGFTWLAVFLPLADWPLRLFAGRTATWFLSLMGSPAQLAYVGDPPKLILTYGVTPFEVASECNGFGIMSGCILLALLLVFSRRLGVADKIIVLILAPLLGLFSNALRILIIVLLAPLAGANYAFMHETVGVALFFGTLIFLWWLVLGLPERRENSSLQYPKITTTRN